MAARACATCLRRSSRGWSVASAPRRSSDPGRQPSAGFALAAGRSDRRPLRRRRRRLRLSGIVGRDRGGARRGSRLCSLTDSVSWAARRPPCSTRSMPSTRPGRTAAPGRRRPGLGGRRAADQRGRRVRATQHLWRWHRRHVRPGDAQGRLGADGGRLWARPPASHVGHRRPIADGRLTRSGSGTRAASAGSRRGVRRRIRRRGPLRICRGPVRRRRRRQGADALDAVPAGKRRRRARRGEAKADMWALMRERG